MNKLLSAEFVRLFKSRIFRIFCIISVLGAILLEISAYFPAKSQGTETYADLGLFAYVFFSGIIAAIFAAVFVGTEYSDGTIRNKLVMGYTRSQIYFTELIVNYTAMLIFFSLYLTVAFAMGYPLCKAFYYSNETLAFSTGLSCLVILAYTSIFTAFAMLWKNKAANGIVSIIVFLALLIGASFFAGRLSEPEKIPGDYYIVEEGVIMYDTEVENPYYVSGTKRQAYEFMYDFLPSGQAYQISGFQDEPVAKGIFAPYSFMIFIFSTLTGVVIFRKKDIN